MQGHVHVKVRLVSLPVDMPAGVTTSPGKASSRPDVSSNGGSPGDSGAKGGDGLRPIMIKPIRTGKKKSLEWGGGDGAGAKLLEQEAVAAHRVLDIAPAVSCECAMKGRVQGGGSSSR